MIPAYTPPTKTIKLPGKQGTFEVRGLSLEDITALLNQSLPAVTVAVEHYRDSTREVFSNRSMGDFIMTLATEFPGLAAQVISIAADDPTKEDTVRRYPAGVTSKALIAVAELTLEEMGDLTDPSPALASLVRQVSGAFAQRLTRSPGSTGPSAEA